MRPTKLTISAFGPYGDTQKPLDFTELNGQNIFVITGKTGAGKTTIFDAICYALYGEGSGELRTDAEKLRSDFATPKDETFVELEFELKGEIYKIRRSPTQERAKQRGEGTTIKKAEAELLMPDGKVITKPKTVDSKLIEILGITKDQFKQIVMLPQGEFKKLLVAPSKDKEEIFRKIFNTYNFKKIQIKLEDRARELRKETEELRTKMGAFISNIKGEHNIINDEYMDFIKVIGDLKILIDEEEKTYKENKKELDSLKKDIDLLKEKKIEAQNEKKLLEDRDLTEKKLEELKLREKDIEEKTVILKKIDLAKEIKFKEDKNIENELKLEKRYEENINLSKVIEENKKILVSLENQVLIEESKEPKRKEITIEISKFKDIKPKILEFDKVKDLVKEKLSEQTSLIKEKEKNKKLIEESKIKKEDLEDRFKNISNLEIEKANLEKENNERNAEIVKLRDAYKIVERYEKAKTNHEEKSKDIKTKEEKYLNIKEKYEKTQDIFRKEKAGVLAKGLEENKPCPVCGSLNHPSPAILTNEAITEEALEKAKELFEKNREEWNAYLNQLEILNNNIKISKKDMDEFLESFNKSVYKDGILEEFLEKGKKVSKEIKNIEDKIKSLDEEIKNKSKLEEEVKKTISFIKGLEEKLENINNKDSILSGVIGEIKSKYEALKEEIPKDIISLEILENKILEKENELKNLELLLKKSIEDRDNSKIKLNKLESEKVQGIKIIDELKKEIEALNLEIKKDILEKGFESKEEYEKIKSFISSALKIKEDIDRYIIELNQTIGKKKDLDEKCKDLKNIDIEEVKEKLDILLDKEKDLDKLREEEISILKNNKTMLKNIEDLNSKFEDSGKEYKVIGELANTTSGKSAPYISFERYVLASYFEDIIDAANIRLKKMTNSRYKLIRKTDKAKGAGAKGLDLDIIDANTGKERDISSISGGESFKASLSLALGLSDIVQESSGGVSLQTIFIDEGFGTLDDESLEAAISTLLDLQSAGRLVGVISHREELKERIGAKLEVSSSIKGSFAKFNVF